MRQLFCLAALLAALAFAACSTDGDNDTSPTPTASQTSSPASDTPTVRPTATDLPATEIAVGDPIDFPDDIALIVETGCWSCDGPATGFVRVYRRPDGSIAQDILFTPDQLGLPPDDDDINPYILGFTIRPDASEMAITVCVTKYCGGLGFPEEGAAATLYRSTDGGVTWAESGDWPLDRWVIGLAADGVLSGRQTNIGAGEKPDDPSDAPDVTAVPPEYEFLVLPEGHVVTPPGEAGSSARPVVTDAGEIWWSDNEGQIFRDDGSVVLTLPDPAARIGRVRGHLKSGLLVNWWADDFDGLYLTLYTGSSLEPATALLTMKSTDSLVTHAGPWTYNLDGEKGQTLYGNLDASLAGIPMPTPLIFGLVPALIDLDTFIAHPIISPFLDESSVLSNIRNRVVAVQQGPFARVTGTGSCLNLRGSPSASAEILICAADGVLLRDTGRTADADGRTWLAVDHPQLGAWAATDFLER